MSWGDYLKTGEFWSNLEKTIKKLKRRIKQNSNYIRDLETTNLLLLEKIESLTKTVDNLHKKIISVEDKVWNYKITNLIYTDDYLSKDVSMIESEKEKQNITNQS